WLHLKDFITERLGLPVDEFNRVSTAGMNTQERLTEMLEAAAFAFVIMTAEDERADGKRTARLNVEIGLRQSDCAYRSRVRGVLEHSWSRTNPLSCWEHQREF